MFHDEDEKYIKNFYVLTTVHHIALSSINGTESKRVKRLDTNK